MPKTTQLSLTLQSKPGVLARVARALADAGVNITALSAGDRSSSGKLRMVVYNPGVQPDNDRKLEIVTDVPERAMVIFAHPDDAEIGSGGVVAKWITRGCEVTYVLCTNGDAGTADRSFTPAELAKKRADEQRAAADFMGVKHVVMLGYPDGELEHSRAFLGDVVRALRHYRPHTVFVHDPYQIGRAHV